MIDICACDVKDKEKLALFRERRTEWLRWLSGKSRHSIFNQVHNLLWYDTVFRTINEARRISAGNKSKRTGFNAPMIDLFDRGFAHSQSLAIRRLTDQNFHHPKKSVFSLVRLVDDISINLDLFTRENYICHDGTKYDGLTAEQGGIKYVHWQSKQKKYDILAGTTLKHRKRKDKIKKSVISILKKELRVCENIRTYVNKFIAHASDPKTRINLHDEQKGITLERLDKCYQAIVRVTSFVGSEILYNGPVGGVSTPNFDHLENLNKPMVTKKNIEKLNKHWNNRTKEIDGWESLDWETYIKT